MRVRESAVPDVRPMCERFIGDRRGELGQAHRWPSGLLRARGRLGGRGLLRDARAAGEWTGGGSQVLGLDGGASGAQLRDLGGGDHLALGPAVALEELLFERAEVADVVGVAIDPGEGIVV